MDPGRDPVSRDGSHSGCLLFCGQTAAAVLVSGGDMGIAGEQENRDPYEKMQKFCVVVDAGHGERIRER